MSFKGEVMNFKEIEFKYSADEINVNKFIDMVNTLDPTWLTVSSYDDYYVKDNSDDFIRYRHNEHVGELTMKKKTQDSNNNHRVEVNLKAAGNDEHTVTAFCDMLGFKPNFSIYKTHKIAILDKVTIPYYIVYDKNLNELRRFIEIEAKEDYQWESEEEAMDVITEYEKLLTPIGITPKHRLRKSLFEIFRV